MKIQNNEIELVFDREEEPDYVCRCWIVRFVKTPKGRRKHLVEISETSDLSEKTLRISLDMNNTKTAQERSKLIAYLMNNAVETGNYFHPKTVNIMYLPYVANGHIFYMDFGAKI